MFERTPENIQKVIKEKVDAHDKKLIKAFALNGRRFHPNTREIIKSHIDICDDCRKVFEEATNKSLERLKKKSEQDVENASKTFIMVGTVQQRASNRRARNTLWKP